MRQSLGPAAVAAGIILFAFALVAATVLFVLPAAERPAPTFYVMAQDSYGALYAADSQIHEIGGHRVITLTPPICVMPAGASGCVFSPGAMSFAVRPTTAVVAGRWCVPKNEDGAIPYECY